MWTEVFLVVCGLSFLIYKIEAFNTHFPWLSFQDQMRNDLLNTERHQVSVSQVWISIQCSMRNQAIFPIARGAIKGPLLIASSNTLPSCLISQASGYRQPWFPPSSKMVPPGNNMGYVAEIGCSFTFISFPSSQEYRMLNPLFSASHHH